MGVFIAGFDLAVMERNHWLGVKVLEKMDFLDHLGVEPGFDGLQVGKQFGEDIFLFHFEILVILGKVIGDVHDVLSLVPVEGCEIGMLDQGQDRVVESPMLIQYMSLNFSFMTNIRHWAPRKSNWVSRLT